MEVKREPRHIQPSARSVMFVLDVPPRRTRNATLRTDNLPFREGGSSKKLLYRHTFFTFKL